VQPAVESGLQQQVRVTLQRPAHLAAPETRDAVALFYEARSYSPAWLSAKRRMELAQLDELAELHGLDARDYAFGALAQRAAALQPGDSTAHHSAFDIEVSQSIARLASDLRFGKVDLGRRAPVQRDSQSPAATAQLLTTAAESASLFAYLHGLAPDTLLYRTLQGELAKYRTLSDQGYDWPRVAQGETLEPGMRDPRVAALRERLGVPAASADAELFDAGLSAAVAAFQARHALTSDGLVGARTITALNASLRDRIEQLRVNLEWQRWAAMPGHDAYVLVNIAQYAIHLVEDGERTWSSRTQVGRYRRQTPTFKSSLERIVANPSWTVPPTIFREDILPEVKADPSYLDRKQMRVIDSRGQTVASELIDWQHTTAAEFPYRLRANPGKGNALGQLKFEMPNPYLVYLHDTPSRNLFSHDIRAFSSGCVRLEEPEQLARLLLERQQRDLEPRLDSALAKGRTRYIELDTPMPIVVMYGTVDLGADGQLVFAPDVYRKDRLVLAAMNAAEPDERDTILLAGLGTSERR
jgi:murein L,D-transpeptidase YcbB/YkuD